MNPFADMNHLVQMIFDDVFLLTIVIGMQIMMLRMHKDNLEIARSGTLFNMIRVPIRGTEKEEELNVDEKRSTIYSSLLIGTIFFGAATGLVFLTKNITGTHIGLFLVGTQGIGLALEISKRWYSKRPRLVMLTSIGTGILLAYTWYRFNNWVVADLAVLAICTMIFRKLIRPIPIVHLISICSVIFCYDLWGVWGSSVGGGAISHVVDSMLKTRLPPIALVIPCLPLSFASKIHSLLGIGDIFFPAFVILTAAVYNLHRWVLVAYAVGLIVTFIILQYASMGVPAMVPILPLMITTLLVVGKIKHVKFE